MFLIDRDGSFEPIMRKVSEEEYKASLLDLKGLIEEIAKQDACSEDSTGEVPQHSNLIPFTGVRLQHRDLRPFLSIMDENFDPWIRTVGDVVIFAVYPFRMIVNSSFAMVVAPAIDKKGLSDVNEEFKKFMPSIQQNLKSWLTQRLTPNKQIPKKDFALTVFNRIMMVSKDIREENFQRVMGGKLNIDSFEETVTQGNIKDDLENPPFSLPLTDKNTRDMFSKIQALNKSDKNTESEEESNEEVCTAFLALFFFTSSYEISFLDYQKAWRKRKRASGTAFASRTCS
jgi:hypothetical protein